MNEYGNLWAYFKQKLYNLIRLNNDLGNFLESKKDSYITSLKDEILLWNKDKQGEFMEMLDKFESSLEVIPKYKEGFIEGKEINQKLGEKFRDSLISFCLNSEYYRFIREMSLVYLISLFEDYLKTILKIYFNEDYRFLMSKEKNLTFEQILSSKNIEEIREKVFDKELDRISHGSIDDINDFLIKKINMDLSKNDFWDDFREAFYRRNLIVHSNGCVNDLYLSKVKTKNTKGTKLEITQGYLKNQFNFFGNVAYKMREHLENKSKQ